jgi:glutamate N-acetyltransferase/amino-acid N-acetyltransferase
VSVTAAQGFEASGVHAGIRRASPDVAIVRSTEPAVGAAMFTANRVQAAPVVVSRRSVDAADPQAVVVNSGIANAATGARGERDAVAMQVRTAELLGLAPDEVIVLSTGVIGVPLPLAKVLVGIELAARGLSDEGGGAAAEAILTTDTAPKQAVASGDGFTVGGMAKGAGMIHPCLATMLAVVTTDCALERTAAERHLRAAVDRSFNRISVDGECSTNDTVVLLANGATGVAPDDDAFGEALHQVCAELAAQVVADGEGATVLLEIDVAGAASEPEAQAIARRIATSPLVKTAAFGHDPNWGRVLAAAGSAAWNGGFARLDPDRLTVAFNGTPVFAEGAPAAADVALEGTVCRIELDLGLGSGHASYLASDLSYEYVRVNAEYRT